MTLSLFTVNTACCCYVGHIYECVVITQSTLVLVELGIGSHPAGCRCLASTLASPGRYTGSPAFVGSRNPGLGRTLVAAGEGAGGAGNTPAVNNRNHHGIWCKPGAMGGVCGAYFSQDISSSTGRNSR